MKKSPLSSPLRDSSGSDDDSTEPLSISVPDKMAENIEAMTKLELEKLQRRLGQDYEYLVEEFYEARVKRSDEYLKAIGDLIESVNAEREYVSRQIESLDSDKCSAEQEREFVASLKERSLAPVPVFHEMFEQVLSPLQSEMDRSIKKYEYEKGNIERKSKDNVKLVWQSYYQELRDVKESARAQLEAQIEALENELYNLTQPVRPVDLTNASLVPKYVICDSGVSAAGKNDVYQDLMKISLATEVPKRGPKPKPKPEPSEDKFVNKTASPVSLPPLEPQSQPQPQAVWEAERQPADAGESKIKLPSISNLID